MMACMAAMMMSQTAQSKTQDVGGRVIDQNGEPLGFVSVALLTADSTYIQGATSELSYAIRGCKRLGRGYHPNGGRPAIVERNNRKRTDAEDETNG